MANGIVLYLFSVFIASCAQILLKKSAGKKYNCFIREYLNPYVVVAYGILFLSSLITICAYRYIPLSTGAVLESCGYVFVAILSVLFLDEKVAKGKRIGIICIILGVIIFNKG